MIDTKVLKSELDDSVNFIKIDPENPKKKIETRFVVRDDTLILYLSSATGCDKSCRMCHLTATGQTDTDPLTAVEYVREATDAFVKFIRLSSRPMSSYKELHFNFMSRGDPLDNPDFIKHHRSIFQSLKAIGIMAVGRIPQKFKISTIFPMNTKHPITSGLQLRHEILQPFQESALALGTSVEFYYSLYSLDPVFRKKWIPKALSPDIVGRAFGMTHTVGRRLTIPTLRIHHALISGENDSVKDAVAICEWVSDNGISAGFNLVRYNSPNEKKSAEASQSAMEAYMDRIRSSGLFDPVQYIQRVGEDVFASCGMFYA